MERPNEVSVWVLAGLATALTLDSPSTATFARKKNIDGVIKLEVKLKASDGSFHFGTQYLQKTHYSIYFWAICAADS